MMMPRYQNSLFGSIGKLNSACHFIPLAKIPGVKSIFKPKHMPIAIYPGKKILASGDFGRRVIF
jgi:hypothetical protein